MTLHPTTQTCPTVADKLLQNHNNQGNANIPKFNTIHTESSQVHRARRRSSSTHRKKRDSKISVSTGSSARSSHQEYLDSLEVQTQEMVQRIGEIQERKEEVIMQRLSGELNHEEREKAANLIQRSYRGHRERRMLNGLSLDPSTRWVEAIREAQYRNLTTPRARGALERVPGPGLSLDHSG